MRLFLVIVAVALAGALALASLSCAEEASGHKRTIVSIRGEHFLINGACTYRGNALEGLLMNSRMVQAIFDDENPETRSLWEYPDSRTWSAERNTNEFIAAIPEYAGHGLLAVTIGLQGGSPRVASGFEGSHQQPIVSAFRPDGTIKQEWLSRLDRVLGTLAANGMVAIVNLFYFGQDHRLENEQAVLRAADGITAWLVRKRHRNVLIDAVNETDVGYDHELLRPAGVPSLIRRIQLRSRGMLEVGASFVGGAIPTDRVIRQADFVLLHGNNQSAADLGRMIETVRRRHSYRRRPKPIVVNEDSTGLDNLAAAVSRHTSWGYFDMGLGDYESGYQSPPVNWGLSTADKRAFFTRVERLTASRRSAGAPRCSVRP